jgi:hypothetical protein
VSVLLGALFLGEALNLRVVLGMVVVLVGVALTRRQPATASPTAPAPAAGEAGELVGTKVATLK